MKKEKPEQTEFKPGDLIEFYAKNFREDKNYYAGIFLRKWKESQNYVLVFWVNSEFKNYWNHDKPSFESLVPSYAIKKFENNEEK